ncbi:MAG: hypothetical protein NWE98_04155 [Candidatus Bathyarchaeota archaeon]|nr:hypothetical protein [Candidatus Bathyarchaeota archaeon]
MKAYEEKYIVQIDVDKASEIIGKALTELGLKEVAVKKFVPPRYLLMQYSPSWVGKALEVEFLFQQVEGGTEMSIKWPYARELLKKGEDQLVLQKEQEQAAKNIERLIEDFKKKISQPL